MFHPSGELGLSLLTLRGHISVPRAGTLAAHDHSFKPERIGAWEIRVNGVIYLVGLVVVVLAILSLLGLR
jgi:hypothetical protein